MTIHSRGAASLVLCRLTVHRNSGVPVLHWFSETLAELKRPEKQKWAPSSSLNSLL